jgi:glutamyl-tRNA reductase
VLQASKEIKNRTQLSGGTVSVSFAAVQMIRNSYLDLSEKHILVLGTGKIGANTCKNLVDYTAPGKITLMNRSPEKAMALAAKFNLACSPIENLEAELNKADIVIAATNAPHPVILRSHLEDKGEKLIIDLSVPLNVADDVMGLENVRVILVDELSKMKDDTLSRRKADIPRAKEIIAEHISEFIAWNEKRKHAPMLSHLKTTLHHLHKDPGYTLSRTICSKTANTRIKKVLSETAKDLEIHNRKGCQFISAINQFMN